MNINAFSQESIRVSVLGAPLQAAFDFSLMLSALSFLLVSAAVILT